MKKVIAFIAGSAIGVLLAVGAGAQSALPGKHTFSESTVATLMGVHLDAWWTACKLMKTVCRDIVPPRVAYTLLPRQYGAFDIGSRTVLVDIRVFAQEVSYPIIVHEMIHYLQDKRAPLRTSLTTAQMCKDEEEAHTLVLRYTQTSNVAKGDPRVKAWADAAAFYGCALAERD